MSGLEKRYSALGTLFLRYNISNLDKEARPVSQLPI